MLLLQQIFIRHKLNIFGVILNNIITGRNNIYLLRIYSRLIFTNGLKIVDTIVILLMVGHGPTLTAWVQHALSVTFNVAPHSRTEQRDPINYVDICIFPPLRAGLCKPITITYGQICLKQNVYNDITYS